MERALRKSRGRLPLLIILSFIFFLSNFSFSQLDRKDLQNKKIYEIKLNGLINTNKDIVISMITLTKGDKFNYKILKNNFKSLNGLGFFKNISVKATLTKDDEIILIFDFDELPKVGSIAIEGESEIDENDIINVMILKPGNIYKDSDIIKDERNILNLYNKKGFDGTSVQIRARKGANNKLVNIIVEIQEGKEVFIETVKIIGTKMLDPDDIYDIMETKESTAFRGGEILDMSKLNRDRRRIQQFFKNNGYWFGKVKSIKIKKDFLYPDDPYDRKKGFFVLIEINEGSQYRMGKVTITGNKIFKDKELYALIKSKEGDIYNDETFQKDIQRINEIYMNRGYIQLKIIPTERVDEKNLILNWDIEIIEGEKVHIERIIISGHEKTRIWVIDQELRIFEGEVFNLSKIKKSVNRLQNTQFFASIEPKPEPGSDDGLVDLNLKIVEQRTGLITVGVGFGTLSGFSVFEEVTEKNVFGTGWSARERIEFGERRKSVELGASTNWIIPYVPVSFSFTFRYIDDTLDAIYSLKNPNPFIEYTYKLKALEFDFTFGHFITDNWFIFTGYLVSFSKASNPLYFTLADVDSTTIRGDSLYRDLVAGMENRYLIKISHRIGVSYDTRDLVLNTRTGWRIRGTATYTGGVYGGDSQWLKWQNDYSYFINPVWDLVFAFFASYEMFFDQFNGKFLIRDIDRLRFDGFNELRGWRQFGVDELVGQGSKVSLIHEIRFPIFGEVLWSVLFADAGDISDKRPSLPNHIHYFSFGFGFRIQIPMIPIRFYFAKKADYNVTRANEFYFRKGIEVVFSVGGFF